MALTRHRKSLDARLNALADAAKEKKRLADIRTRKLRALHEAEAAAAVEKKAKPPQVFAARPHPFLRTPPETIARIESMVEAGETIASISSSTGVGVLTVSKYRKAYLVRKAATAPGGVVPPHVPVPPGRPPAQPASTPINPRKRSDRGLRQYRNLLPRMLPVIERAKKLVSLARDENAAVSSRALERIDELEGITARLNEDTKTPVPGPMFIIPAGICPRCGTPVADIPSIDPPAPSRALDALALRTLTVPGPAGEETSPASPPVPES